MFDKIFIFSFLFFTLVSTLENWKLAISSVRGELYEFRKNQKATLTTPCSAEHKELSSIILKSKDELTTIYDVNSNCYNGMDKSGITSLTCNVNLLNIPGGIYSIKGFVYKNQTYDNTLNTYFSIRENTFKDIRLTRIEGNTTEKSENQKLILYFDNDITSLNMKKFTHLSLSCWRGMAHPTLDCKYFIGQTGLFCISDFTGTYYYTHELLGVYYMNTLIKANNGTTITPKKCPGDIYLSKIEGNIKELSWNQELNLEFYDERNKDIFNFDLRVEDIRYIDLNNFGYKNYIGKIENVLKKV